MVELQMFLRFHLAPCFFVIFSIQKLKKCELWMQQVVGAKVNESWIWQDGCRNNLTSDKVWERAFSFLSHCTRYYSNFRFLITFLSLSSYFRQIFFIYQIFYNKIHIWQGGCGDTRTSDKVWERAFSLLSHCNCYNFYFSSELLQLSLSNYVTIISTF